MDGNRRFAREIGLGNVLDGHVKGRDKLEEVLEWCLEVGVRILTVFAFSTENIRRANEEVEHLMHLFAENFRRVGDDDRVHRHQIRVSVFGNRELLPPEVIEAIEYAEGRTKAYDQYRFNVAVAYGGREEILRAIRDVGQHARGNEGGSRLLPTLRHRCLGGPRRNPKEHRHALPLRSLPIGAGRTAVRPIRATAARVPRSAGPCDEPRTPDRFDRGETVWRRRPRDRRSSSLRGGGPPRPKALREPSDPGGRPRAKSERILWRARRANHPGPRTVSP